MLYLAFKHIHVTFVALSIVLFTLRGIWMLADSAALQKKWVRILPHIIDTGLLVSAIALLFIMSINPFSVGWLTAKIIGLVVYIVLGTIALKRGKTKQVRVFALALCWLDLAYIVSVAITKNPLPFIS
ncbi:SirB2 family protein [Pokkaliibacter sp. CJK22405]|uniref:SirB2 family protein n=1 Tax=Pokkaliibacter sp. CJK22405 TaxID=3384615 RepID=UPI00398538AD